MRRSFCSASSGFSLVELVVALAIGLLITSAVFAMLDPSEGAFQTQPETADTAQRLRAASDALRRDLVNAGSGPSVVRAPHASTLLTAAIHPMRVGRRNADGAGTFSDSRLFFWSVAAPAAQATLAAPLASASGTATVSQGPGCAEGDSSCGFRPGMQAALVGRSGAWDLFSVTAVQGPVLTLQHNLRDSPIVFGAGDVIAEATARTYFFRDDRSTGVPQLMRYDAAGGADVPVVDHVVAFHVDYFGDAEPPAVSVTAAGESIRSTYGPLPPQAGVALTAYPPGENCVFARGTGGAVVSRLSVLAPYAALVPLTQAMLTDGPWCPDALDPNRYDADLLRIRQVVVTLRVEAAVTSLRGPAGPLFTRGGTARGNRFVADRFARLVVTPRSLNLSR
jgi:prepilin-type N-terminal cleavage/methylation domain-containing protein